MKVVKTPYDPDELHPELRNIFGSVLGFNFYDFDDNGKVVEYNEAFGKEAKQNYFSRIYDLAYEICEILKKSGGSDNLNSDKDDVFHPEPLITWLVPETGPVGLMVS